MPRTRLSIRVAPECRPRSPGCALHRWPNLYGTAKTLGFDIDYKHLLQEFNGRGALVRAFYYTAIIENQEFSSIRPLVDWLDYNGYTVVTKATKEFVDASGRRKVKGNMGIELAVDAMELAGGIDEMMLCSGDGDFRPPVEAVQRRGVRVTVVSSIASQPPMVADEVRRQADTFTDLMELRAKVGRDPSERPPSRARRDPLAAICGAHHHTTCGTRRTQAAALTNSQKSWPRPEGDDGFTIPRFQQPSLSCRVQSHAGSEAAQWLPLS